MITKPENARPPNPAGWAMLMTRARWIEVARIVGVGVIVLLYSRGNVALPILLAAVAIGIYPLIKTGLLDLVRERRIGTEIFVTIATGIALLGGEYSAGAILMVIILIAEFIAELNTERARASIRSLIGSVPQVALVRRDGKDMTLPVDQVAVGDIVIVRAGEKIPVDGSVVNGSASVNQAPITGESIPSEKIPGAQVFAGTIVELGALDIQTVKVGGETMFSRIIALVETAEESQAPVQRLADRVAAWLIPVVLLFLLGVWFVTNDLKMIITLLIFTSPAELGLATPLVVIAAIARAAKAGILLKGGVYLEQLAKVTVLAFDKTGTLTIGRPAVSRIDLLDSSIDEPTLLRFAAAAERRSSHPLAKAVVEHAEAAKIDIPEAKDFEVHAGRGVKSVIEGRTVLAGNAAFLTENSVQVPASAADAETVVMIALDGVIAGILHLADPVKPDAARAIASLRASGIKRIVMLTGDNAATGKRIAAALGIDQVEADLLPDDKVRVVRELQKGGQLVAMVGDGINDAPALAAADIGIAMGVAGTQAAIEAADIALMTDDIAKIADARLIARRAYRTIKQNLFVGVGVVHILGITAALLKLIGPVEAAIIHLGPDVLVFLNSVRLLRMKLERAGPAPTHPLETMG